MLLDFHTLVKNHHLEIDGIIHVGAHQCEEREFYPQVPTLWIEAQPRLVNKWNKKFQDDPYNYVICAAVSNEVVEDHPFYVTDNKASSSLLELGTHLERHPNVHLEKTIKVNTQLLDTVLERAYRYFQRDALPMRPMNFLNLDIQGAELRALQGMTNNLRHVDYIYTEVNEEKVYVDCCLIGELDEYLSEFKRVETHMTKKGWGDALYVRQSAI